MAIRVTEVSGDRLVEFLSSWRGDLDRVDVTSSPREWGPLKPAFREFIRAYRDRGVEPPRFAGVPLCLFGSEWSGFPSTPRRTPATGRCAGCGAREQCGFAQQLPEELLPLSESAVSRRWHEFGTALRDVTGSRMAVEAQPILDRLVSLYGGPVSVEPSVLLDGGVDSAVRFVVFPHRSAEGGAAGGLYREVLESAQHILDEIAAPSVPGLFAALAALPPMPVPLGLDGRGGEWSLKMYLRLEDVDAGGRRALLEALGGEASGLAALPVDNLAMVGLVLGRSGLQTVKAYLRSRPTRGGGAGFPPVLESGHPLVRMCGDSALATLDIWTHGPRRANKWDFNVRDHYLAGEAAESLVAELASPASAARIRPLLAGAAYRSDIVAVGVRGPTLALYMELN